MNKREEYKISKGQFFTKKGGWVYEDITNLIKDNDFKVVLDPFFGEGDLLKDSILQNYKKNGFDIDETLVGKRDNNIEVKLNDSLKNIPTQSKDTIIITNPPYFSRVSSTTKNNMDAGKYLIDNSYNDIYMLGIANALKATRYSIFIIPETFLFLRNNPFLKNIVSLNVIEKQMFLDTEVPVLSVLFDAEKTTEVFKIYKNGKYLFDNTSLEELLKETLATNGVKVKVKRNLIKFNDTEGQIFLRGIDSTTNDKVITFKPVDNEKKKSLKIKSTSRFLTLISIDLKLSNDDVAIIAKGVNKKLSLLREQSYDLLLSPFKGNNKDGERRRRLDFKTARKLIESVLVENGYI